MIRRLCLTLLAFAALAAPAAAEAFYEFKKQPKNRWDSAFLNADGTLRPAYHAFQRGLRRTR